MRIVSSFRNLTDPSSGDKRWAMNLIITRCRIFFREIFSIFLCQFFRFRLFSYSFHFSNVDIFLEEEEEEEEERRRFSVRFKRADFFTSVLGIMAVASRLSFS